MERRDIGLGLALVALLCATNAFAQTAANPLLAIDQHRATIVERVVGEWGDRLSLSGVGLNREQLREMLNGLRADQLLAASLVGSLTGLRDVLAQALAAPAAGAPRPTQAKALGDSADDVVYTPVTPCRLVETRGTFAAVYQGGGAFGAGEIRNFTAAGGNGVCLTQLPPDLNPSALQLQVFGIPNNGVSGDIEVLPQGATFGGSATLVFVNNVLISSASTTARVNLANNQIGVQVRIGSAHVAIDVVGYFNRPTNYGGTHTITGLYATDSGGSANTASGDFSTVAGGQHNSATGENTTVGGGFGNTANAGASTVSGGSGNFVDGIYATIGGGTGNLVEGLYASVSGGLGNTASGLAATVVGGYQNIASGNYSLASGRHAKTQTPGFNPTAHDGTFLFADSSDFDFNSTAANQFAVRATGGARLVLDIDVGGAPTWICSVSSGGSWACSSDRNLKQNLRLLDGRAILAKLAAMPVYEWNPKGMNARTRHLGPTAQDFYAAFGLGESELQIGQQDADGVALAAIQGLNAKVEEQRREIDSLRERVTAAESLRGELAALKSALADVLQERRVTARRD